MERIGKKYFNLKSGAILWFVFHFLLIFLGLSVPWEMDSDLHSVLPNSNEMKNISAAENILDARSARNIVVVIGHENFEKARSAAIALDNVFRNDSSFDETLLFVNENALNETRDFFFNHRYTIQDNITREALAMKNFETLKIAALKKIYGSFTMADLSNLDEDPFLLGESSFEKFVKNSPMASSRFHFRDGVLYARESGIMYVKWSAVLSEHVSSVAVDGNVIGRLNQMLDSLKAKNEGFVIAKSGFPFHCYESSSKAKNEIAWISGISVVLILILLLYVFRSLIPIVVTFLMISLALFTALALTWFAFGKVHIFTFVFGTSVIGVSIDYAVHFFTSWKNGSSKERNHVLKGLLLGFLTTELSYIALSFAGFPLLTQMAVFSIAGLLSSFLTITLLLRTFYEQRCDEKCNSCENKILKDVSTSFLNVYTLLPKRYSKFLVLFFAAFIIPGLCMLNVHTDMKCLYSMSEEMKFGESLIAEFNNLGASSNYFIVEGVNVEDVLQNENALTERLEQLQKDSVVKSYLAISNFIPSKKLQKRTSENFRSLFFTHDSLPTRYIDDYLNEIGIENDSLFITNFNKLSKRVAEFPENSLPWTIQAILRMLWIGSIDEKYYSAVLPLHVTDSFDAQKVAYGLPHVFAVNKMKNINDSLTDISHVALLLVGLSYVVVFFILVFVYKFKDALIILRAPVIAGLFVFSFLGYMGINVNFFAIVGVILTLGIGIDYALFFRESGRKNLTTAFAVMLSALTTLISFGSLALSGFTPVASFGFVVLLGVLCCFLLSPLSGKG